MNSFVCVSYSDISPCIIIINVLCYPGEGNGNPLQCYCLENPMDRGAGQAAVHMVAWSQTRLKRLSTIMINRLLPSNPQTSPTVLIYPLQEKESSQNHVLHLLSLFFTLHQYGRVLWAFLHFLDLDIYEVYRPVFKKYF